MLLGSQAHVANKVRCLARAKGRQKYDKRGGGLAIEEGLFRQRDWQEAEKPEIPPTLSCPAACCSLRSSPPLHQLQINEVNRRRSTVGW